MPKKIKSTQLVKRLFPAIYKSNSRYYVSVSENTNIVYLEEHEVEILINTDEHIKAIRTYCSHGSEIKLLGEWKRGTSIFTSIYTP